MIRHAISSIALDVGITTCGLGLQRPAGSRVGDVLYEGEKRHERDAGDACPLCFATPNGYYAPFRGNDTMGVADKVTVHLADKELWPEIKAMSDDEGAIIGYNVQFGPDHAPVHVAVRREPNGPGFTIEALLAIAMHRLWSLNKALPSAWNDAALTKMQRALEDLHDRTKDRQARGIEGTNAP